MNNLKISSILPIICLLASSVQLFANAVEYGKVTYYANKFHGKKTANGELYHKDKLTCAHKTYPFGTILRVTRMDTGNSVEVRVNDRGPHAEGYVVDISYAAAEAIDLVKAGVAKVKVEVVEKPGTGTEKKVQPAVEKSVKPATSTNEGSLNEERTFPKVSAPKSVETVPKQVAPITPVAKTTAKTSAKAETKTSTKISETYKTGTQKVKQGGYGVQILTLSSADNLMKELAKLEANFPGKVLVNVESDSEVSGSAVYKLIVGPFATRKEADAQQKVATKKGHSKCFVVEVK